MFIIFDVVIALPYSTAPSIDFVISLLPAEVYAFEVPDPTGSIAAAQNLTQRPGSQSSWLRVQKLVLNPKGDQRGGSSGEYENPSDGLL